MRRRAAGKLRRLRELSARHDGELSAARVAAVEQRLADDTAAVRFVAEMTALDQALAAVDAPEPRAGFTDRLMARLPEQGSRLSRGVDRLRLATRVVAAAAALSLGMVLGHGAAPSPTTGLERLESARTAAYQPLDAASEDGRWLALSALAAVEDGT